MEANEIVKHYPQIGETIRELRTEAEWSQQKLANTVNVTVVTINRIENQVVLPSWELLLKIANCLGYKPIVSFKPIGMATHDLSDILDIL